MLTEVVLANIAGTVAEHNATWSWYQGWAYLWWEGCHRFLLRINLRLGTPLSIKVPIA